MDEKSAESCPKAPDRPRESPAWRLPLPDASGMSAPRGTGGPDRSSDGRLARPAFDGAAPPPVSARTAGAASGASGASGANGRLPPERSEPLHGTDPYSTPPYGGPGPWAPAPLVQRPAATPAHGVPLPSPVTTPAAGTPVAAAAPEPAAGAPAPGAAAARPAPLPREPRPSGPRRPRYDPWTTPPAPAPVPPSASAQSSAPAAQDGPAEGGGRHGARLVAATVALSLAVGIAGGLLGAYLEREGLVGDVELPQAGSGTGVDTTPGSVAGIAKAALPGVVTLHDGDGDGEGTGTRVGSGFVLDDRGHILTNSHVVESAARGGPLEVAFHDGRSAKGEVVGTARGYDLAVVRVSGLRDLEPLPLGDSESVAVGDPVVAVGAPFGLAGTVTYGIVSATHRPVTAAGGPDGGATGYVDALQTDAAMNPGNSGGPLLDSRGRVVGINSAIRSAGSGPGLPAGGGGGSVGLGFAIPVDQGRRVAEELINDGRAVRPVLGVRLDMGYGGDGARVATSGSSRDGKPVVPGGPGEKAGLEPGDVVTAVDGTGVHSAEELIVKARGHRPGDVLRLTVRRDGKTRTVTLELGSAVDDE